MWGRSRTFRLVGAALVALSPGFACGGRSARQVAVEDTGGSGGAGGSVVAAGAGGVGSGGAPGGAPLRPCGSTTVPVEKLPSRCQFALAAIPSERVLDPALLTFALRSARRFLLLERTVPECSSGWFLSEDETIVHLCFGTCEALRNDPELTLEVSLLCDGPPPRD